MQEQLTNIDPVLFILLIVFGIFVILLLVIWRRTGNQDQGMKQQLQRLADNQAQMQGAFTALHDAAQTSNGDLQRSMDARFENFGKRMGDSLSESREKTHENLKSLGERLAIIDRAQKNIEALGQEVSGLQSILANKQTRGAFGEMRMQDMVEDSLQPSAYGFQQTLSNNKRVDCLIFPPNGAEAIPVDAKFPLESWRALQNAPDDMAKKQAAASMRNDIKKHVKDIASKYIIPGETTDTALLFLPSEAIYADLHGHFPDLIELAFRARVMIVSPTTFMATLYTISALMKDARMREQANVIQREVGLLLDDVRRLDERTQKLDKRFKLTGQAVDEILKSTTGIIRHAERIGSEDIQPEQLDDEAATPPRLSKTTDTE
ncbi:DNA recombination protein RmuC [hydrothermal vent metagenome]|uniref:DNA recombination protein RmuC n=1 Tax=hydrothermal vent metagenome TaxID=652676 RepID=A0A3B0RC14_9ZZZZ